MGREHLDGHAALQLAVVALEHDPHAAAPDDLQHVVTAEPPEHVRIVGRLQVFDREIGGGPFVAGRHGVVELVAGQQRRRLAAPGFAAGHLFQRRGARLALLQVAVQEFLALGRQVAGQGRFQQRKRTGTSHFTSSHCATAARSRASTRHLATRTAPTAMPSFAAASAGDVPTTAVSQKASHVAAGLRRALAARRDETGRAQLAVEPDRIRVVGRGQHVEHRLQVAAACRHGLPPAPLQPIDDQVANHPPQPAAKRAALVRRVPSGRCSG